MQASQIPKKLQLPFAKNAAGGLIRTVPVTSQIGIVNGAASYNDGFVPDNAIPLGSGGVPPSIEDFNGVLNDLSALLVWYSAGGPIVYDATFQTAVGGYPKGAIVLSTITDGLFWQSTTDNNSTNPDAGGAGWIQAYAPPPGSVFEFSGSSVPAGYLAVPLTQTLVSAATYPALFAAIGYTWGGSAGSFSLPYLESGYVPVQGTLGALTHGAVIAHTHSLTPLASGGGSTPATAWSNQVAGPATTYTNSTGGADNLAAGRGYKFIVKY